jgi:carbonic anhydrase
VDDELVKRLARFERSFFPKYREAYRRLVKEGQHPRTLFIGCSDSRIVPYVLTGTGPGDLFVVRNVGNLVPPYDPSGSDPALGAAVEFAVQSLRVRDIVICGHSHCGAIRALYEEPQALRDMPQLARWLDHARDAVLPVTVSEEALRRTEQRSIVLQLERLMGYPAVAAGVAKGAVFLHGWHYIIEEGRILVLDVETGRFVATDVAMGEPAAGAADAASYQLQ